MMTRSEILKKAEECVCQSRQASYGDVENNFSNIAKLWNIYLDGVCDVRSEYVIYPEDVAIMMILLKIARIASGHQKDDNWIDIAGYAACGGELDGEDLDAQIHKVGAFIE